MIRGDEILSLIDLFKKRDVVLFHSCQYVDFRSYLELGGIPSRMKLEKENKDFTEFDTDAQDKANEVWDLVFLNPHDYGQIFMQGHGVPTTYGPIHLLLNPEGFYICLDVAVAILSAGRHDFRREEEGFKSVEDVDRIFRYPADSGQSKSSKVKGRDELNAEFNRNTANFPEISMKISDSLMPLSFVNAVIVDEYDFQGTHLHRAVERLIQGTALQGRIRPRSYHHNARVILNDITQILLERDIELEDLFHQPSISPETRKWVEKILEKGLELQWSRYSRYLRRGTILPLQRENHGSCHRNHLGTNYGLYKCGCCGRIILGFDMDEHYRSEHPGRTRDFSALTNRSF